MIKIIEDTFPATEWNKHAAHPMQSWEWGEARKKMGITVLRVGEFTGDTLTAVFQATVHTIPNTPYCIEYLPRSSFPSQEVLNFLAEFGKTYNVIYIKVEPNVQVSEARHDVTHLIKSPVPLFPAWTQVLALDKSEEDLLKGMKPKTRYNIRLAQKKGVTVKEMTNQRGFDIFLKLYFETCKRQHYSGHNEQYHQILFDTLKKDISHILIAFYNNVPVAAYHLLNFNNVLYYPYGGSSDQHREVMGTNLLMWEAVRLGKKLGATSFDLWGSLPPDYDPENIWSGFTRFKEGYGSRFTEMTGSYDFIINNLLYWPLIAAQKIREKVLAG